MGIYIDGIDLPKSTYRSRSVLQKLTPEEKLKQAIVNAVWQLAETIGAEHKELVHCKDCKYRDPQTCATSTMWLPCMGVRTDDDWFCADGERRTHDG